MPFITQLNPMTNEKSPMQSMPIELQFAAACVGQASQLAMRAEAMGGILSATNLDGSTVTSVDYAVQAWVGSQLEARFPNDHFIGEEGTNLLRSFPDLLTQGTEQVRLLLPEATEEKVFSWVARGEGQQAADRFWLLDPITPTRSLLTGGIYSIQLAGFWDGQVQVAAMLASGLLFIAGRGQGSWLTLMDNSSPPIPLHVSSRTLKEATRLRADPPNELNADRRLRRAVSREIGSPFSRLCTSALRYPLIAEGSADLLIHLDLIRRRLRKFYSWRHAAGSLLVEEAGGRVSDLDGHPLDFTTGRVLTRNRGLVVSNGLIHDEALAAIRRATESI